MAVRVSNDAGVSFCIDSTEVTVSQYQVFVDAKKGDMSGQITPDCDFNTTYEPRTEDGGAPPRSAQGDIPVGLVDWCDAYAYCKWANKRLCGRIGGGPAPFALPGDATESQWMFACSAGGAHPYAYGATFDTNACNDGETYSDIAPVKKFPKCTGGFPGLFDMSGNVEEWEDSCDGQGHCNTRGGSAWDERYTKDHKEVFSCGVTFGDDWIDERYEDVGFRCCSP